MLRKVTGQKDPAMVLLRELVSESGRVKHGLFITEELELVRRAFEYGGNVTHVIVSERQAESPGALELMKRAEQMNIDICCASEGLLAKLLEAKPTPDFMCITQRKLVHLNEVFNSDSPLIMMVESCENADNLGMLLRSTDAAGMSSVILTENTVDPFCRRSVRGSRGAVFTVPICMHRNSAEVIEAARKNGLRVIATSANADVSYDSPDYTLPTMLIVGNEHTGISNTVREMADAVVRIPMLGRINSLNIAVAASLVMYEAVRQRR